MNKPILFCWIGNTDIEVMAHLGSSDAMKETARAVLKADKKPDTAQSPRSENKSSIVLTLRESLKKASRIPKFDKILLLTNRPNDPVMRKKFESQYKAFITSLVPEYKDRITIAYRKVDAYDFESVYSDVKQVLDDYIAKDNTPDNFWYNITPGTIPQQTSWIMLGKERFADAHFVQASKSREIVSICRIPFDPLSAVSAQASFIESDRTSSGDAVGQTPIFLRALSTARKIAKYPVNVLLTGQSGTGKEVLAREIHKASGRTGDFIAVNCATLDKELGISDLAGQFKGAFTGAVADTKGKLHLADKGTLFLDEIGDCPLDFQSELLRILQPIPGAPPTQRRFWRKGNTAANSRKEETVDVRIICATNRDLSDPKIFREDLYYRIETFRITVPSLEERKAETDASRNIDDIKDLALKFLADFNSAFLPKSEWKRLDGDALRALHAHKWRGNVRELQNVMTRSAILAEKRNISAEDIRLSLENASSVSTTTSESFEKIVEELARHDLQTTRTDDKKPIYDSRIETLKRIYCLTAQATSKTNSAAYTKLHINPRTFKTYTECIGES